MNWDPDQANFKFTDDDVRRHPGYHDVVLSYLDQYHGSFTFLLDVKRRVENGLDLTTGHVRGVLNCMRIDPRVQIPEVDDLPKPKKRKKGKKSKRRKLAAVVPIRPEKPECELEGTEHDRHYLVDDSGTRWPCWGWHSINREISFTRRARFHAPYIRGRSSNLIHRSTHEGTITWWTSGVRHSWGMASADWWHVKAVCPVTLKQPSLLDAQGVEEAEPYEQPSSTRAHTEITLCQKCFPTGEPT